MCKINSFMQYALVSSIQEIEEITKDLQIFVQKTTGEFSVKREAQIASHRIMPIEKLYKECPFTILYGKETCENLVVEQVKKNCEI